ncbi:hypothetical protein [Tardiphaga sp. 862_B3_N1_1]|uniref:hypothetical protein n=1 Tax=Tardiphaga sp. 862_B3_N1_1 TaxID=3240763 RepID=UPI003F8CCA67
MPKLPIKQIEGHTPGPWLQDKDDIADSWITPVHEGNMSTSSLSIASTDGEILAFVVVSYDKWDDPQKERQLAANARLIAQAPAMLAALKAMDEAMCNAGNPHMSKEMRDQGRQAIIATRAAIAAVETGAALLAAIER